MAYPHAIQSIAHFHPALGNNPDAQNMLAIGGVFSSEEIGAPMDLYAAKEAENTLDFLLSAQDQHLGITAEVIETAKNRSHIMRDTHASHQFKIPGINQFGPRLDAAEGEIGEVRDALNGMRVQLDEMKVTLRQMNTQNQNTRIIAWNRRVLDPAEEHLRPLRKETIGEGWELLIEILGPGGIPEGVQDYHPQGNIGDAYVPWNPNVEGLEHPEIARLIIFYNNNFGIEAGDCLVLMRQKVWTWLRSF